MVDTLTFDKDSTLLYAAEKLKKYNAGAGVILNNGKLCGIITERDIVNAISSHKNKALEIKLKLIMTKKVVYLDSNKNLITAIEILKSSGFRHLPIYDDKKLKYYGIISYKDFMLGNTY